MLELKNRWSGVSPWNSWLKVDYFSKFINLRNQNLNILTTNETEKHKSKTLKLFFLFPFLLGTTNYLRWDVISVYSYALSRIYVPLSQTDNQKKCKLQYSFNNLISLPKNVSWTYGNNITNIRRCTILFNHSIQLKRLKLSEDFIDRHKHHSLMVKKWLFETEHAYF